MGMPLQLPRSTLQKHPPVASVPETVDCFSSKPEWPPLLPLENVKENDLEDGVGKEVQDDMGEHEKETSADSQPGAEDTVAAMESIVRSTLVPGAKTTAQPKGLNRPAAAMPQPDIKKRPSAYHFCEKRPSVPPYTHTGNAISYGPGRVLVSQSLNAYRVFLYKGARAEKRVLWHKHSTRSEAWSKALDLIDDSVTQ